METAIDGLIEIWDDYGERTPRLRGSRIRVEDIVLWHVHHGESARDIVRDFPQLTLATVHGALAYYYERQVEMDSLIAEGAAFVESEKKRLQDEAALRPLVHSPGG